MNASPPEPAMKLPRGCAVPEQHREQRYPSHAGTVYNSPPQSSVSHFYSTSLLDNAVVDGGTVLGDAAVAAAGVAEPMDGTYAKLIYSALKSKGSPYAMPLQDIYHWIKQNTRKAEVQGWQSSVRHNLSRNEAFVSRKDKSRTWYLEASAVHSGVLSTGCRSHNSGHKRSISSKASTAVVAAQRSNVRQQEQYCLALQPPKLESSAPMTLASVATVQIEPSEETTQPRTSGYIYYGGQEDGSNGLLDKNIPGYNIGYGGWDGPLGLTPVPYFNMVGQYDAVPTVSEAAGARV